MSDTRHREEFDGLVAGRLEGMSVPDLMWLLCRRRLTGTLCLERRGIEKRVFFQDGHIVFAASTDPNDRLGEMLLREGLITLEKFESAISNLGPSKRLGAVLVEGGSLKPEDLVRGVLSQFREIVIGLFTWEDGEYRFEEGPLPRQEVVTLDMRTGEILLHGIRRIQSFSRIRHSVGGPRTRYRRSPVASEVTEGLSLSEAERLVLQRLQSGPASVEALCREIYASNFEIHQALWALKVLGAVSEADQAPEVPSGKFAVEGTFPAGGVVEILVRLCRAGETGVLHVTRGAQERSFHVKQGRCIFATSNSIDDGLIAFLLRRGIISLQDREETARRLLSNKRVGTILLEMGVLDENDLRDMVRQQLSEIVYDTFRWEDGEYAFISGDLPTIEEIVLEASLEDLVSEGLRRVTPWSRVRAGCGADRDCHLALTPDFLSVLDRMRVGADEWEVVSVLGEPRLIPDVCRATKLGDFRVCQILWALRLLGAVREVPAEELAAWKGRSDRPSAGPDRGPIPVADAAPEAPAILGAFEGGESAAAERTGAASPAFRQDSGGVRGVPAPAWLADLRGEQVPLSVTAEPLGEVVSEPWRLVTESFPPRSWASSNAGSRGAGASEESAAPEVADPVPPIDSPADATRYLSRDEVESALGLGSVPQAPAEQFELAEPGTAVGGDLTAGPPDDLASAEYELAAAGTSLEPEMLAGSLGTAERWKEEGPVLELDGGAARVRSEKIEPVRRSAEPAPEATIPKGSAPEETAADPLGGGPVVRREDPTGRPPEARLSASDSERRQSEASYDERLAQILDAPDDLDVQEDRAVAAPAEESESAPKEFEEEPLREGTPEHLYDLDQAIRRFNQRHRVLYRAIRSEIGAGAVNFIRSCRGGLGGEFGDLFEESRLLPDGTWDADSLKRIARERRIREPWLGLERLLDREFEMLRPQIGEARGKALREQLLEVSR